MATFSPDSLERPILVVDDEPDVCAIVAEGLEMCGYAVLKAGTAEEALTIALKRSDLLLVVSDMRLPGMSGIELAERMAKPDLNLKTILISGYFSPQAIRFRLLSKPFNMRDLDAAIQSELDR